MNDEIKEKIKKYLRQEFDVPQSSLNDETYLLDDWIKDSIHLLSVVQFLEHEFGVTFRAEDMKMENFSNVLNLSQFTMKKRSI